MKSRMIMDDLNCGKIIKESSLVLSGHTDIHLLHYVQKEEKVRANMCVHMNMIGIILNGKKEILGYDSKTIVPAGCGFFMKKGSYLVSDKVEDLEKGYEAIIIFFSDEWLQSQVDNVFQCIRSVQPENGDRTIGDIALLAEDTLMMTLALQLKSYLTVNAEQERLRSLLPIKIRELFQILITAPEGYHFETQLRSLDTHSNPNLVLLMQSHFKENLSLEQYAFLANCSLSTFKRKFQQTFNMNPGKWIMQRKLEEAYELLKSSKKNITEIAYEVGFETPAHFIAAFRRKYRNTPKQLQQVL